jgi:type VI secretion system protein ImpG
MSEALYPYYERELVFVRQLIQEFGQQYPAAAGRLMLEPGRSGDPHIERLIESFALLAARIHYKLDDEFPELTDALLNVLYPHYLAPVPSMGVVQFGVDAGRSPLPNGFVVNKGSYLHTRPVNNTPCRFRTCYPVTLWPVELTSARLIPPPFPPGLSPPPKTAAALTLQLECQAGMTFADLSLETLRFFLVGDNHLVSLLYELVFNHVIQVVIRPGEPNATQSPLVLRPEQCLRQVGFERDEGLLPYPDRTFLGYRLITELFAFPYKFHFVDLSGFKKVAQAGYGRKLEVVLFLNRTSTFLEQGINADTFRLGCTPIVNLFPQVAEPIHLNLARHEYKVIPDVAQPLGMEVYSVDAVTSTDPTTGTMTEYQPFYAFRHGYTQDSQQTFWYPSRRLPTREGDRGTDVYLNLVDLQLHPRLPADSTLVVRTTCTNRALPGQLQRAGEDLYLELEGAAPLARISCPRSPTTPLRPPLRRGAHWRAMSHLTLNHLSLAGGAEGRDALQEILRLYDFSDADANPQLAAITRHLIEGIVSVSSRRVMGRTGAAAASGFARGVEVTVELDEQKYVGSGAFLFASVLERFLALYVSINSFSQLVARTSLAERDFKKWPPRAGELQLL